MVPLYYITVQCDASQASVSIYNGFASATRQPEDKVCGQMYFQDRNFKEFKSNNFRIVLR